MVAGEFGLDVVLGAFLAGAVLRRWAPGEVHAFESKLDALGYGFFIPVFFVFAGMGVDLPSIREAPARLFVFLVLLLVVRGLPVLVVYRHALAWRERTQLMLCTATTLPLIVALTQIGLNSGTMLPENAAALVGAGVPVLLFPSGPCSSTARAVVPRSRHDRPRRRSHQPHEPGPPLNGPTTSSVTQPP